MIKKKEKMFNGKPMSHWERAAKKLVVSQLLRSGFELDTRSIVGRLAGERLKELANTESPELVKEVLGDYKRYQAGMVRDLKAIFKR